MTDGSYVGKNRGTLTRLPVHKQPVTDVLLFRLVKRSKLSPDEDLFKYSNKNAFPCVWPRL